MRPGLSPNTQAILLLTAPLIAGRVDASVAVLTLGEYKRLARFLREKQREPADLLAPDSAQLVAECGRFIGGDRLERLLARGFLLSQATDRWTARAIWIVSRADAEYPSRVKARLRDDAPPILYGCGEPTILEAGGLAVVGSRHVVDSLVNYAESIGRLAARSSRTVISGSARGIDQASMSGALEAGGKAAGVLADSLERAAMNREHRNLLIEERLVLISPYDPAAGFNVGNAMQRNKLIYALADSALVVSSDRDKGGTWAGAIEQLEKLHFVPVYVRSNGDPSAGLEGLVRKGAMPWPNPQSPKDLIDLLDRQGDPGKYRIGQGDFSFSVREDAVKANDKQPQLRSHTGTATVPSPPASGPPAEELFAKVRDLLRGMTTPRSDVEVARDLCVSKNQAKVWLQRLVKDGVLEKLSRPVRYRSSEKQPSLFDQGERKA